MILIVSRWKCFFLCRRSQGSCSLTIWPCLWARYAGPRVTPLRFSRLRQWLTTCGSVCPITDRPLREEESTRLHAARCTLKHVHEDYRAKNISWEDCEEDVLTQQKARRALDHVVFSCVSGARLGESSSGSLQDQEAAPASAPGRWPWGMRVRQVAAELSSFWLSENAKPPETKWKKV